MTLISPRFYLLMAAVGGFLSVSLGAFGAHTLQGFLTVEKLTTYETANRYLMYHSLALLAISLLLLSQSQLQRQCADRLKRVAGLWTIGCSVFSGSLYILCLADIRWLVWLTPIGGLLLLAGWVLLVQAAYRYPD
ncbi:DUF423 domain-containing protein [Motiliproteus sp. MSK22-1]|uniref:DUF423 domain-containing protein n=1 Tax=Motiliproteus sp. MSK22-1 TaxID=1897630 RepID=UPI000975E4C0|nr:DUF423 domain-containing protein [Motiliproteus sp. MSK22-1]OMH39667.1 hypothetical protein BGP75_02185 [Motiliproteus sp. MSK22-1]